MKRIIVLLVNSLAALLRRTWLVAAITVASCAVFAARAASALVAAELTPASASPARRSSPPAAGTAHPGSPPGDGAPGDASSPASRDARLARAGAQLVERNMFCSSCTPALAAETFTLPGAVLIETSLGSDPRATLRVLASEAQGSWGLGQAVPGLGWIDHIAPTWIELVDTAGHRGRLSLLEPAAGGGLGPARHDDPPAATPWTGRFRQLDEQTYEVDRDLVRELVTGITKPGTARFLPLMTGGQLAGFRIVGVTAASIPAAFGLKSGDTVTAIDGEPIKSIQQGIDLFARLDQVTTVELSGTRAGKPLVRTLRLR